MASLSRKGGRGRPKPAMNVTPLVDVVLVLLIIFMVVIPAMEESLNLEVPPVVNVDDEEEDEDNQPDPVMLALTSDGRAYLNEEPIPDGEERERLRRAHLASPRARLVLRGDRGVEYSRVRDMFSIAQAAGYPGVSLRVNRRESGESAQSAEGEGQ